MSNQIAVSETHSHILPSNRVVYKNLTVEEIRELSIPANYKEPLIARYSEYRIRDLERNYAGEKLRGIINLTIFESGYKVENISELIIMIIKDVFSDFSYMTLGDVSLACRKGVRGQLGDFMGLSVKTFYGWFKTYNEEVVSESNRYLFRIDKPQQHISDSEKQVMHRNWLESHIADFTQFKESGICRVHDYGNIFYEYLVKNSIVILSNDEKVKIKETARGSLIKAFSPEKAKNPFEMKDYKAIVNNLISFDKSEEFRVVSEAKRLAIPVMYNKLISQNIDLAELIAKIENWK